MNSYDFSGQTAIVTGGGQGIGLTVAERILASGGQSRSDRDTASLAGLAAAVSRQGDDAVVDPRSWRRCKPTTAQVTSLWGESTCG
jgi:3-oxoacyl-[acyl-carrier protein] reductase